MTPCQEKKFEEAPEVRLLLWSGFLPGTGWPHCNFETDIFLWPPPPQPMTSCCDLNFVVSKPALFNPVATSHTWLCTFHFNYNEKKIKLQFLSCTRHVLSVPKHVASVLYSTDIEYFYHLGKFYSTAHLLTMWIPCLYCLSHWPCLLVCVSVLSLLDGDLLKGRLPNLNLL